MRRNGPFESRRDQRGAFRLTKHCRSAACLLERDRLSLLPRTVRLSNAGLTVRWGMARRRLPIGIQTFRKLREQDCYYVDKTAYIRRRLLGGTHHFLSRPRRFGKSLLLDTLKGFFEGNQELFAGLHIHDGHDWSERHPVVRLDFGRGYFEEPGTLHANLSEQLDDIDGASGVRPRYGTGPERFGCLIKSLHERTGQRVVVLVDEYDKPILDALEQPRVARANRGYLRGLYGVIKASDSHVHFTFLTGVTKFAKVSVFSVLNKSHRPHPGPPLLGDLRLHGTRPGHGVRARAFRSRPGAGARVVRRLPLAWR